MTITTTLPTRSGWAGARDQRLITTTRTSRRSSKAHPLDPMLRTLLYAVAKTSPAIVRGGYLSDHLGVSLAEAEASVREAVTHGLLAPGSTSTRLDLMTPDLLAYFDLAEYGLSAEHREDEAPSGSYAELSRERLTEVFA
ncbi:hypothetical protein ACWFNE_15045 [Cellulomonas sp. NPDC055163]